MKMVSVFGKTYRAGWNSFSKVRNWTLRKGMEGIVGSLQSALCRPFAESEFLPHLRETFSANRNIPRGKISERCDGNRIPDRLQALPGVVKRAECKLGEAVAPPKWVKECSTTRLKSPFPASHLICFKSFRVDRLSSSASCSSTWINTTTASSTAPAWGRVSAVSIVFEKGSQEKESA